MTALSILTSIAFFFVAVYLFSANTTLEVVKGVGFAIVFLAMCVGVLAQAVTM